MTLDVWDMFRGGSEAVWNWFWRIKVRKFVTNRFLDQKRGFGSRALLAMLRRGCKNVCAARSA